MPQLAVTSFVTAVLALFTVALAAAVVGKRVQTKQSFGDGGDPSLLRVIRAHGNITEYAPIFLLLLALLELRGVDGTGLRLLGSVFVFSRIVGVVYSFGWQRLPLRIVAFQASVIPIVVAAIWLLTVL